MNTPAPPAVRLRDVRCDVPGRTILRVEDLTIGHGERVALFGRNGAGKSTLLQLLTGFREATAGRVDVLGRRVEPRMGAGELRRLRCEVGQVFQGLHLVGRLTAFDNVAIGASGRLTRKSEIARGWFGDWSPAVEADATAALASVGLLRLADQRVTALSGGERQRVAIARMLVQRPRLILADEPTANLDAQAALQFGRLLRECAPAVTTITVAHDPALVATIATRVVELRDGSIVFDGPIDGFERGERSTRA